MLVLCHDILWLSRTVVINLERKLQTFREDDDLRYKEKLHKEVKKKNVKTNQAKLERTGKS